MKKPRMKYHQAVDGEWIRPVMRGYRMKCCGCGLVHHIDFRVIPWGRGHKVLFRAFRLPAQAKFQKIGGKWRRY